MKTPSLMRRIKGQQGRRLNSNVFSIAPADEIRIFDRVKFTFALKNDSALAFLFGVTPDLVCKVRAGKSRIGMSFVFGALSQGISLDWLFLGTGAPLIKQDTTVQSNSSGGVNEGP